jgi:hypothetical protein
MKVKDRPKSEQTLFKRRHVMQCPAFIECQEKVRRAIGAFYALYVLPSKKILPLPR